MRHAPKWAPAIGVVLLLLLVLASAGGAADVADGIGLSVTLETKTTTVKEGASFTVKMVVTNTSGATLAGVHPYGYWLTISGDGWVELSKFPAPVVAVLDPGETVSFSFKYRATLVGAVTLTGFARAGSVSSDQAELELEVVPKSVKDTGVTDAEGNVWLKAGKTLIPLHFADERTGLPIPGLAVAITVNPKNKGEALVVTTDAFGRYPLWLTRLRGGSEESQHLGASEAEPPPPPASVDVYVPTDIIGHTVDVVQTGLLPSAGDFAKSQQGGWWELLATTAKKIQKSKLIPQAYKQNAELVNGVLYGVLPKVVEDKTVSMAELSEFLQGKAQELLESGATDATVLALVALAFPEFAPALAPIMAAVGEGYFQSLLQLGMGGAEGALLGLFGYEEARIIEIRWGKLTFLIVAPPPIKDHPSIESLTSGLVHAAAGDGRQPISGGCVRMKSTDGQGFHIQAVLDTNGEADIPVPIGDYDTELCGVGYEPLQGQIVVTEEGGIVAGILQPLETVAGELDSGDYSYFLGAGDQIQLQATFFDGQGQPTACPGPVKYVAMNPPGAPVISVDANGTVTMLDQCGAGTVTAWCSGVTTTALTVSSDCGGKQPIESKKDFIVSPPSLSFSMEEGDPSPPPQSLLMIGLMNGGFSYSYSWFTPWNVAMAGGDGVHSVSIDGSGFGPGTYSSSIRFEGTVGTSHKQTVPVTLHVKAKPPAQVAGDWAGTWTWPVAGFCDETAHWTWHLVQSGKQVTGTYTKQITGTDGLCPDPVGTILSGQLVFGHVQGNTLTIFTGGGTGFEGTVSGNTLSGVGGTSLSSGAFTLTKQ